MREDGHVVHRSVSARKRWYFAAPVVLAASFFLLAGLAEAVPRQTIVRAAASLDASGVVGGALDAALFQVPPSPDPSGAEPPYPLNHTLDGETTSLGAVQNADFETEPGGVGSAPTNADLEAAPVDVAVPANGDFETGDFTGWTLNGSPTIQSDAPVTTSRTMDPTRCGTTRQSRVGPASSLMESSELAPAAESS